MSEVCFEIPAVRGIQAGREFFTINAPFGVLQRLVAFDTGNVLSRSQREVNPNRAKKISQYIQDNPESFVLTSLTGVINERPDFIESEHANVGILKVSMDSEILLFDGQHRSTGIIDAIKSNVELRAHNVPLMLFLEMTLEERQQAFSDINGHTVKPSDRSLRNERWFILSENPSTLRASQHRERLSMTHRSVNVSRRKA